MRRIPGATGLGLKTGKLPDPISQSAFYSPRWRPLLALGTGEVRNSLLGLQDVDVVM
jgi:hypothetical protein